MSQKVSTEQEYNMILESNKVVVVDFTATWCGPCRMVTPKFEELADDYPYFKFIKVDVDEVASVADTCGIRSMPTFHVYISGIKSHEVVGANVKKLRDIIEEL